MSARTLSSWFDVVRMRVPGHLPPCFVLVAAVIAVPWGHEKAQGNQARLAFSVDPPDLPGARVDLVR